MTKLEKLVDDYLDKHSACIEAGLRRDVAKKNYEPQKVIDTATDEFIQAHNARAAAFRALAKARKRTLKARRVEAIDAPDKKCRRLRAALDSLKESIGRDGRHPAAFTNAEAIARGKGAH